VKITSAAARNTAHRPEHAVDYTTDFSNAGKISFL